MEGIMKMAGQKAKVASKMEEGRQKYQKRDNLLFKIPPDFELCEQHRAACIMRIPDAEKKGRHCICCHETYDGEKYPLNCDPIQLAPFGFGVTLYFFLLKCIFKILAAFFLPTMFVLLFNMTHGFTDDVHRLLAGRIKAIFAESRFVSTTTPGNICAKNVYVVCIIQVFSMIILYLLWVYFCRNLKNKAIELDVVELTPSDYTICLSGLPQGYNFKEQEFMSTFFYSVFGWNKIKRTTFCYKIDKYQQLAARINIFKEQRNTIDKVRDDYRKNNPNASASEVNTIYPKNPLLFLKCCRKNKYRIDYNIICKSIEDNEKLLKDYTNVSSNPFKRAPNAFITFNTTEECEKALERYGTTAWQEFTNQSKINYDGRKIFVSKAMEPEDILWEHMGNPSSYRKLITWAISISLLVGCLIINYILSMIAEEYKHSKRNSWVVRVVPAASSIIIVINNLLLIAIITYLTKQEKQITLTSNQLSLGIKITIALFLNTAINPLLCTWGEPMFGPSGVVMIVFFNWVSMIFVQPLVAMFDILDIPFQLKRWMLKKQGTNCGLTQLQANKNYEPPQVDIPKSYAEALFILFYTAFYLPIFPLGIVFALLKLFVHYWVAKVTVLRGKKSNRVSPTIAIFFAEIAGASILLFFLTNSLIIWKMGEKMKEKETRGFIFVTILASALLGGILLIRATLNIQNERGKLRKHSIWNKLLGFIDERVALDDFENYYENIPYDLQQFGKKDYMFLNPLTRAAAIQECIEDDLTAITEQEKKLKLDKLLKDLTVRSVPASQRLGAYSLSQALQMHQTAIVSGRQPLHQSSGSLESVGRQIDIKNRVNEELMSYNMGGCAAGYQPPIDYAYNLHTSITSGSKVPVSVPALWDQGSKHSSEKESSKGTPQITPREERRIRENSEGIYGFEQDTGLPEWHSMMMTSSHTIQPSEDTIGK